jgi:phosphoesterase RecJ-like protein
MRLFDSGDKLRSAFEQAERVLLTGPVDPDGDSLGACLALARAINHLSTAKVDVAGNLPYRYRFLPDAAGLVPDADLQQAYDLVVVMDSAAASTCHMVMALLDDWQVPLDRDIATMLYTGIIFDTGGFRHSNTGPKTHRLAARLLEYGIDHSTISLHVLVLRRTSGLRLLGHVLQGVRFLADGGVAYASVSQAEMNTVNADQGDLEGIIDALLHTEGVELACLLVEQSPTHVKLSLRSRRLVDVAALAQSLSASGGGHVRASGALVEKSLTKALIDVPPVLVHALRSHPAGRATA